MKISNKTNLKKHLTKRNYIIAGVLVLVVIVLLMARGGETIVTANVEQGLFQKETRVAGKVVAKEEAVLGFTKSGRIEGLSVDVGDIVLKGQILARLNQDGASASVALAQSNVDFEDAKFDELARGSRQEELRIQESKVRENTQSQQNAQEDLYQELINSYIVAEDAVTFKLDQAFDVNGGSGSIKILFSDYDLRLEINRARREIQYLLKDWEKLKQTLPRENISSNDINTIKNNLEKVRTFATLVSEAVAMFESNSNTTQTTIDGYRTSVSQARTLIQNQIVAINTVEQAYQSATQKLNQSMDQLDLLNAGASPEELAAQRARISAEQARLQDARTVLSEGVIRAPFNGKIVQINAQEGEPTGASEPVLVIISEEGIEIESFIPEVFIGSVTVEDIASIIFDAYPGRVFKGVVSEVEPKETLRDGISTYRTSFQFGDEGANILLGMTADVTILAEERPDTIMVPLQSVQYDGAQAFVQVRDKTTNKDNRVDITVGDVDSQGRQEVRSGLSVGDIVTYEQKN